MTIMPSWGRKNKGKRRKEVCFAVAGKVGWFGLVWHAHIWYQNCELIM